MGEPRLRRVVQASFIYGFCLAIAACGDSRPQQRYGVTTPGPVAPSPASATVAALALEGAGDGATTAVAVFAVQDGDQVVKIPITISRDSSGKMLPGSNHFISAQREYRLQAACQDLSCSKLAVAFYVAVGSQKTPTKAFLFTTVAGGASTLVAEDDTGRYASATAALAAFSAGAK
jgi:hypothetical protein